MSIKERIQETLKIKGITSQNMEKDLSLAKGYISKLDKSTPNVDKMCAIANYLNVSIDYLITGSKNENCQPIISNEEMEIIDMFRQLDKESKQEIKMLLDLKMSNLIKKGKKNAV